MNSWGNINSGHVKPIISYSRRMGIISRLYVKVPEVEADTRNGAIAFQDFSSRSVNPNSKDLKNIL